MTTPTLTFPPLAAVFLTHFDDIKGQSVLFYKSIDERGIPAGKIEHTSLPSGLHLLEQDFFGFVHENKDSKVNKGPGIFKAVGLFRSRVTDAPGEGGRKGRGRRMATLGVVLAKGLTEELFELKRLLGEIYDQLEEDLEVFTSSTSGQEKLRKTLDRVWSENKADDVVVDDIVHGQSVERLLNGSRSVSANHPITFLPTLINILGPHFVTVYKAAIAGRRILIYTPPPLQPSFAFTWCISAMSLSSEAVRPRTAATWLGHVGLMDLDGMSSSQDQAWVASTSDKILLSHNKAYDLSIDLSGTIPDPNPDSPSSSTVHPHVEINYTSPEIPYIRPASYTFSDIPLYKSLQAIANSFTSVSPSSGSAGDDWWMTIYDLLDRVWSICAGVCEYAVGRGRVGALALSEDDEDARLIPDLDDDGDERSEGEEGEDEAVRRGRMIMRQLHHNTFHLQERLKALRLERGEAPTLRQVRELTGKWIVKEEDARFWMDLARRWNGETDIGQAR